MRRPPVAPFRSSLALVSAVSGATLAALLALQPISGAAQVATKSFQLTVGTPVSAGEFEVVCTLPGRTATLISRQTVLTAAHCVCPGSSTQVGGPAAVIFGDIAGLFAVSPQGGDLRAFKGQPNQWERTGGPGKTFPVGRSVVGPDDDADASAVSGVVTR